MKKYLLIFACLLVLLVALPCRGFLFDSPTAPCGGGNDSNTMLLLHFNGATTTFTDSSSLAHTMAGDGTVSQETSVYKYGGSAVHFSGDGTQYIINTGFFPGTNFDFASGNFTVDGWINLDSSPNAGAALVGLIYIPDERSWAVGINGTTLTFYYTTNGGTDILVQKAYTFTSGTWYHIAIVRDGNTLRFFVNGQSIGTSDFTGVTIFNTVTHVHPITIGRFGNYAGADDSFKGYVDELRVSNVARWTSNFIPYSCEYN